jgi:peroxiredoxin
VETLEPKPITREFWTACVLVTLVAVGGMVAVLMNPDWLSGGVEKAKPIDISFTVPGEFSARSLSDFRGRVIVVSLWRTSDCPDCLQQLNTLQGLSLRYGREGLMSILVSEQDSLTLLNFPALRGMQVMTGHMEKGQSDVLPRERPYTYLIDRQGLVRKTFATGAPAAKLEGLIVDLLGR